MEQKEQTAVEWLVEKLFADNEIFGCSKELIEKAKEMEKQQIIDAWMATDNELQRLAAEHYYNEEYEKTFINGGCNNGR